MDAGRMRERITIRRRFETKNARGGLDVGWENLADNISAEIVNLDGREALQGNVLQGIATFRLTTRFRRDVKQTDQVQWHARMVTDPNTGKVKPLELNIRSAEDRLGTRQWLTIIATTDSPQGA